MAVLQEYKCPCCGGAIAFDSGIQKMKCPYCDTEFEMEALAAYDSELSNESPDDLQWESVGGESWQEEGIRSYVCKSCGGEIIGDENTAATACPYCGNPNDYPYKFCGNCGKPSPQMQQQQPPAQPAAAPKSFKNCPYCGEDLSGLPKTPKFCPYCAEQLS